MADVSRDRAQLIIVSGLALAVTLVALAVILNSAIYTGNLSTREESHDTRAAIEHQASVDESVGRAIRYVNTRNPSKPNANLSEETGVINDRLRRNTRNGVVASVSTTVTDEGTRIAQLNASRNFTAGGPDAGDDEWTLIDSTESTRMFRMRLNKSTLFEVALTDLPSTISSNAFKIEVTNTSGDTWNVYIYQSSITGNAYLLTIGPSETFGFSTVLEAIDGSCAAAGPEIVVDFTAGTFGPAPDVESPWGVSPTLSSTASTCPELSWYDPTEDYKIRYENTVDYSGSDTIAGKYELVVGRDYGLLDKSEFYEVNDGRDPFAHGAINEVNVSMAYQTDEVTYSTNWTTSAEQERIFTGTAPVIKQFDVTEQGDANFKVNWTVSDADGDLRQVTVSLYDLTNEERDDQKNYTVSGNSARDDYVLESDESSDGNKYEIRIRVRDSQGHVEYEEVKRTP